MSNGRRIKVGEFNVEAERGFVTCTYELTWWGPQPVFWCTQSACDTGQMPVDGTEDAHWEIRQIHPETIEVDAICTSCAEKLLGVRLDPTTGESSPLL